jgi:quercetin dioxygenase-like cupin family protein
MITLDEIKQEENYSHSLIVTYPRTVQISHGVYDNVVDMHNMCTMISQNIDSSELTNVYANKTHWNFFNDKPEFIRFMNYVVQKHQTSNSFFDKKNWNIRNLRYEAWGNEIKKGDSVGMHMHETHHCILYLTEGAPLILPELKMTIYPKKGHYYIFPPFLNHGVNKIEEDLKTRYCLVVNIMVDSDWKKKKLVQQIQNAREKK